MSSWTDLKADTHRQYGRFSMAALAKGFLANRTFRVLVSLRLCQGVSRANPLARLMLPPCKLLHRLTTSLAAMDLPWRTTVGAGLALTHGWGLVVNQEARIGRNVTLFHGVTLGRRDRIAPSGERLVEYPVIEDEVFVGPHAVIIGGVTIGRGSRIAAGAVITEDVPAHSVVAGNPAAVVKSGCTPDVMNPAPLPAD
ncbi:MAG: serine acetyltransferase [Burkholderiaceae bacterium]|nr:serine acetyltransferase [Burkholderiaceae bacterium]